MKRTARHAHRTGLSAVVVPARAAIAVDSSPSARAGLPADPSHPATLERDPRQVGLDRSIQLARISSLPRPIAQEGAAAALAITGTGHRPPARTGSVLSLHVIADRYLDRSWDRAVLTGARA